MWINTEAKARRTTRREGILIAGRIPSASHERMIRGTSWKHVEPCNCQENLCHATCDGSFLWQQCSCRYYLRSFCKIIAYQCSSLAKISFESIPSYIIWIKKAQHFFVQSQERSSRCKPALAALPEPPGEEPWSHQHCRSKSYANRQLAWSGLFHPPPFDFKFVTEIQTFNQDIRWSVDSELTGRGFCQLELKFHNFKKDGRPPDIILRVYMRL